MASQQNTFERPVNWRIARVGFRDPASHVVFDELVDVVPSSEMILFMPHDKSLNVIELRNWLHDSDNNGGGYQMTGCYESNTSSDITFTGLKFAFCNTIDAVFFRLCWSSAIVVQHKYSL